MREDVSLWGGIFFQNRKSICVSKVQEKWSFFNVCFLNAIWCFADISHMSLIHHETGRPLTYLEAREQMMDDRTERNVWESEEHHFEDDDFFLFPKEHYKFSFPLSPPALEFITFSIPRHWTIVCLSFKMICGLFCSHSFISWTYFFISLVWTWFNKSIKEMQT